MFARIKQSGKHQYLQIVENRKVDGKVIQRVMVTLGRMDQLHDKERIETLIRSLSRYSRQVLLILSGKSDSKTTARKIGPALIFERLWRETGIQKVLHGLLTERRFGFDVERAVFLTVLHRLCVSGSDRWCDRWHRDYAIDGVAGLSLHQLYRAMAFLGETIGDQPGTKPGVPRCNKDLIEEGIFFERRELFTGLDLVFFDTTSIYFEGQGGETLGRKGYSRDRRPDLDQMVVGAVIDSVGNPICCELWPGNAADVSSLLPVIERLRTRFQVEQCCVVADRGMISDATLRELQQRRLSYILGARMRKVTAIRQEVLADPGPYREVRPERKTAKDPAPLKVKEVMLHGRRYIVCRNEAQARKESHDRQAMVEALSAKIGAGPKSLVGNRGYRKYLTIDRGSVRIDHDKVAAEARFDGTWVLTTNTDLPAETVALKYKELWQVEQVFRDVKTIVETRPIYHQRDETIRGHVFCSFLALLLRKELDRRLTQAGHRFEWADIKQDLQALQEVVIEDQGRSLAVRTECLGTCGKVFQAVGVAIPPTIREI